MYVDIHCHLDHEAFAGTSRPCSGARTADLKAVISNGTGRASNEAVRAICERYPLVRPAYGLYPTEAGSPEDDDAALAWIQEQALHAAVAPVAIGEVGLDGVEPVTEKQRLRFRKACRLAAELRLPIIVHSRKAEQEVLDELETMRHPTPVVLHCFGGNKRRIRQAVERKYFFSVPASIARSQHFRLVVELVPLGQLLTETDAPYLSADKEMFPNEPAAVVGTVAHIARIKGLTVEECKQILFMNYQRLFA